MHCLCFSLIFLTSTCLWLMTGLLPLAAASLLTKAGLFTEDDKVEILESKALDEWIIGDERVKIVNFYAHWCGHCQRFAPKFKAFAQEVTGWQYFVGVGVINCADAVNSEVCKEHSITGYPTLKLFWIEKGGRGSTKGETVSSRDPAGLQRDVITFLENKYKENGKPRNFPDLAPSSAKTIQKIWTQIPALAKHILAVVETPDSFVGRELILDFSSTDKIVPQRFLRGTGPEELRNQDSVSLSLIEGGVHPRVLVTEKDPTKARAIFIKHLKDLGFDFEEGITKKTTIATSPVPLLPIGNYNVVYLDDIEAGIAYTLRQEVSLKNEITARQMGVLKSFIQLIYENIDLPYRIRNYLEVLVRKMHVRGTLPTSDFPKLLKIAESKDSYLSRDVDYVGCKGSILGKRGYTCSLWTIFHYITVGSHARFLAKKIDNPNLAVLVIKDYIMNFFSCTDCVEHFAKMSANIESELTNPNESVLWLWRSHNEVNARLKGDMTEDPQRPKLQFPPPSLCKECHVGDTFNELEVLKFLHHFYSSENLISSEETRTTAVVERYTDSAPNGKYFSGFDLTIFLVIYAVSITLLFVVFVAMVCRRRKAAKNALSSPAPSKDESSSTESSPISCPKFLQQTFRRVNHT